MRNKYFTSLLICGIFFMAQNALAQVTVVLQQPPPYQFKVEQMWKVTLINPSNTTYRAYLKGTAIELEEGLILYATTAAFTLPPGMKIINARELVPLKVHESNPKYTNMVAKIGGVPTGDYEICVTVFNSDDDAYLGEMCVQSQVMNLTQVELLQPEGGVLISSSGVADQSTRYEEETFEKRFIREMDKIGRTSKGDEKRKIYKGDSLDMAQRKIYKGDSLDMAQRKIYKGDSLEIDSNLNRLREKLTNKGDSLLGRSETEFMGDNDNEDSRDTSRTKTILLPLEINVGDGDNTVIGALENSLNKMSNRSPNIIFSWLPPVPVPPGVRITYTLRIKEIYGPQSPDDAIRSNPSVFVMEKIFTNIFQFPVAARRLLPGRRYAWLVEVFIDGFKIQESDIRSFEIQGGEEKNKIRYDVSNASTTQYKYNEAFNNNKSELPSGLSSITSKANSEFGGSKSAINNFSISSGFSGTASPEYDAGISRESMNGNSIQSGGFGEIIPQLYSSVFGSKNFEGVEAMDRSDEKSEEAPITLSGNARLEYQYTNPVGSFSEIPKNSFNAELNPGIMLYGIPLSINILYSTMQSISQNINSFSLNFDFESMRQGLASRLQNAVAKLEDINSLKADEITKILNFSKTELDSAKELSSDELFKLRNSSQAEIEAAKSLKEDELNKIRNMSQEELESVKSFNPDELSNLRNPNNLTDNLQRYASISGVENFFMSILSLGVGTNYPTYSEFTLRGVPVTGVNIEINPGIFYAAFTGSENQRGIENWSYKRNLYAGRIGLGKKEGMHLYFTGLYAKDDANSIVLNSANNMLTPKENYVFGSEVKMNLFSDKLTLEGEGAVAVLTRDTRDPELDSESIPNWIKKMVDPRISTSQDYSYSGKLAINNDESATKLFFGIKMIGPGYTSLGVYNLRTDQFGYEAKLDQRFFERHVSITTFFKRNNDNLIKQKSSTTTMNAYGINLGINFPRIPFLRISYSSYSQTNDDVNPRRKIDNTTSVYSLMTGYFYRIGNLNTSTSFVFSGQQTKTINGLNDYRVNSFMVTEVVSLNIPLSFTASWGLIQSTYGLMESKINNIDLGANAQVSDLWSLMAGMNFASEVGHNRRTGFYVNSNFSPIRGIGIDLRAERNVYTEQQLVFGGYDEFLFSATMTAQW